MVLLDLGSDLVLPSWTPLAIAGGLLVLLGLLYVSLRRHLRRISLPGEQESPPSPESGSLPHP